jgi:hypothetical protein
MIGLIDEGGGPQYIYVQWRDTQATLGGWVWAPSDERAVAILITSLIIF